MDIAVAAFYLLNEAALGVVGVAHERAITDVIGKGGKEKAVFAVGAEDENVHRAGCGGQSRYKDNPGHGVAPRRT